MPVNEILAKASAEELKKEEALRGRLALWGAASFYENVWYREEVTSTNDILTELAKNATPGNTALVAGRQTRGRGRRGRVWENSAGETIAFSVLLRPEIPAEQCMQITPVMGLAAAEAAEEYCGAQVRIKWPNDLVAGTRKLSGTLTELVPCGDGYAVIVGTGINGNISAFPEELRGIAISLKELAGTDVDTDALTAKVLERFAARIPILYRDGFAAFAEEYEARLAGIGETVTVEAGEHRYGATLLGSDAEGRLRIRREDGTEESLIAGEVSVRGLYGIH